MSKNQRAGKAISILLVLLWIGAVVGGVYGYVQYQKSVAAAKKIEEEEAEKKAEADRPKLKGLQVPRLTIPEGEASKAPERTKPFKYLFSDAPSTLSESQASNASNELYEETVVSPAELKTENVAFLLKGVEEYRQSNSEGSKSKYVDKVADLLQSVIKESCADEPKLESFKEELEPFLTDGNISGDPFFQYLAAKVTLSDGEKALAQQLFYGSIIDHQKWEYPARFAVMAFNARQKTNPKRVVNFKSYERHADAIVHWLQNDFSESTSEHRHCWQILKEATECLCKAGKREMIVKILDKDKEKPFITPWLKEMLSAQLQIQIAKLDFASDEVVAKAKGHLQEALKINPNFWEAENDLKVIEELASPASN